MTEAQIAIMGEVSAERTHQKKLEATGVIPGRHSNNANDFVALIAAYAGRAAERCPRNERQGEDFRCNMLKVAALAVAAIEAHDERNATRSAAAQGGF